MTDNFLQIDVITPETSFSYSDIHSATMPGSKGEFGVMPGHVPMIVGLSDGIITLQKGNHLKIIKLSISNGFCEVTAKKIVVLTEKAEEVAHK